MEGGKVDRATVGVAGGRSAAADVAADPHPGPADTNLAPDPRILAVSFEPVDADCHPKPALIDWLAGFGYLTQSF